MNIIAKQSFYNTASIFFAFFLGAINTLILYPKILGAEFYGLVLTLLANSNLLQPFFSFGIQHSIIKFYYSYSSKIKKDTFLSFSLLQPWIIITPIIIVILIFYNPLLDYLSQKNAIIRDFVYVVIWVAIATSYFEIFYSWLRIHLKTVFGNFLKEVYPRLAITILLSLRAAEILNNQTFITLLIASYYLRLAIIIFYAFSLYRPKFYWKFPKNTKKILKYCLYILLSGSAASILIDIDKFMIPQYQLISEVSFYAVAIFIASVIEIPGRALFQIISPLTSKALSEKNNQALENLLKNSANNLLYISGFLFLCIQANISNIYTFIPNQWQGYEKAFQIVIIVSFARLFNMSMGCVNHIISNSKYYPYQLYISITSAAMVVFLNVILIPTYGINGAAWATVTVLVVSNIVRIGLVFFKFKMHPYSKNSIKTTLLILSIYFATFTLSFSAEPLLDIVLKITLIGFVYIGIGYLFNLAPQLKELIINYFKKISH